jgi:hypothetical protein
MGQDDLHHQPATPADSYRGGFIEIDLTTAVHVVARAYEPKPLNDLNEFSH